MKKGYYGQFGGRFVPQVFIPVLDELEAAFRQAILDPDFQSELNDLLIHFAGRETPLYRCRNLIKNQHVKLYLKREDLLHGGAHKTNQVLGQALLAKRMGKQRLIAETGAGQHGVATAIAGALLNLETCIYMGEIDCQRQASNVYRMELMGATVIPVKSGSRTLKDAINEAMRDWSSSYHDSHYLLGTAAGPHPFPQIVKYFQKIIGDECRQQILATEGRLPDQVIACVGGGSNAIGIFSAFLDDDVQLIGVEAAGHGLHTNQHGATLAKGEAGILHGSLSLILQENGQISETHSVSAGLDYPGIGPEHAYLQSNGRVTYQSVTDDEAISAYRLLSQREGIIPALESAHAIAFALKQAALVNQEQIIIVNLSGRGDKDLDTVRNFKEKEMETHDYSLH